MEFLNKISPNKGEIEYPYDINELAQSVTILYRFGDDKVDVLSPIWKGVIKYKKIKQLFENDIRFYIMNEKNMDFIIPKDMLTFEQIEFLRKIK